MNNEIAVSAVNVLKGVIIVALAVVFVYLGAAWLKSTLFYAGLGEKPRFQSFLLLFFAAAWSAKAITDILFRLVPCKRA